MSAINRSRAAILAGAKEVVAEVGSYESNMVEIAKRSQVSRATIYNHFSDKEEMMAAVLASEIDRLINLAAQISEPASALAALALDLASDPALAMMIKTDRIDTQSMLVITGEQKDHPLRQKVLQALGAKFNCDQLAAEHIQRWLVSFILNPTSPNQALTMAKWMLAGINQ